MNGHCIKTFRRLGKKRTSNSTAGSGNVENVSGSVSTHTGTNMNRPSLLFIECHTDYGCDLLLNAKRLKDSTAFKKVYINKDRTESERQMHAAMLKERNERNNGFQDNDRNGRVYKTVNGKRRFWAIRDGNLRLVESAQDSAS